MKIGDEVFIHGYVDETRKDTVIIRNDGGYFGTVESEISAPKMGRWVGKSYGTRPHCSECGAFNFSKYKNYCPRCGAKMEKEET